MFARIGPLALAASVLAAPQGFAKLRAIASTSALGQKPASFAVCSVCHATGANERSGVGPGLRKVVNRRAGAVPGYAYSAAMKGSMIVWDKATLKAFIAAPRKVVPGTKMAYVGTKDPAKQEEIANYLLSLK